MIMRITMNRIVPLVAAGAAAVAIAAAPTAAATTGAAGPNVHQTPGNVQITAVPGEAAQEAAQAQQPFGGDMGALGFHH
jgi:ABC-type phosphate/phosphonate transport system substrate-binding protein